MYIHRATSSQSLDTPIFPPIHVLREETFVLRLLKALHRVKQSDINPTYSEAVRISYQDIGYS